MDKINQISVDGTTYEIEDASARERLDAIEAAQSLTYELSADGTYYIVTGKGTVKGSEIVIPDTHEGKPVRRLAVKAFYGDEEVTKITVGANVTYIGGGAIVCPNLAELYFTMTPEIAVEYLDRGSIDNLNQCGYFIDCEEHSAVLDGAYEIYSIYNFDSVNTSMQGNCAARFLEYAENAECYGEDWNDEGIHTIDAEDIAIELADYA